MGAVFYFTARLINLHLNQEVPIKLDKGLGLIENLLKITNFIDIADKNQIDYFKNMMIAWMDIGPSPSVIATMMESSLKTDVSTAIAAGVGAASGLKHTSARVEILKTLLLINDVMLHRGLNTENYEILNNEQAYNIVSNIFQKILDDNGLLFGFGHYFFKGPDDKYIDPRIGIIKEAIFKQRKSISLLNVLTIAKHVCSSGILRKNNKSLILPINSDGYWSVYLYTNFKKLACIDKFIDLVPIFTVLTRVAGLTAHDLVLRNTSGTFKILGCGI
jgi:citrate synthase